MVEIRNPGNVYTKKNFMKLQQFTRNQLLVDKLKELKTGENRGIVIRDNYQKLLEDSKIRNTIINASNITDEELYQIGLKTLPELAGSITKESVKLKLGYLGKKIDSEIESLENALKSGSDKFKKLISWSSEFFS